MTFDAGKSLAGEAERENNDVVKRNVHYLKVGLILLEMLTIFQQQQAGEDASMILGDKLQQKMDSVTFTQERMKRQLDDLQDKVQVRIILVFPN